MIKPTQVNQRMALKAILMIERKDGDDWEIALCSRTNRLPEVAYRVQALASKFVIAFVSQYHNFSQFCTALMPINQQP